MLTKAEEKTESVESKIDSILGVANMMGCNLVLPLSNESTGSEKSFFISLHKNLGASLLKDPSFVDTFRSITEKLRSFFSSEEIDNKVCGTSCLVLGSLSRELTSLSESESRLASNFNHLDKNSAVRQIFEKLENLTPSQLEKNSFSVSKSLSLFTRIAPKKLPQIKWSVFLRELLQKSRSYPIVICESLLFATRHNTDSSPIIELLSQYSSFSFSSSLQVQYLILDSLPVLLSVFNTSRSLELLTELVEHIFKKETSSLEMKTKFLYSLKKSLFEANNGKISSSLIANMRNVVLQIFNLLEEPFVHSEIQSLSKIKESQSLLTEISLCISEFQGDLRHFLIGTLNSPTTLEREKSKAVFIAIKLVENNLLEVSFLGRCRSWCLSLPSGQYLMQISALSLCSMIVSVLKSFSLNTFKTFLTDTLDSLTLCTNSPIALHLISLLSFEFGTLSNERVIFPTIPLSSYFYGEEEKSDLNKLFPSSLSSFLLPFSLNSIKNQGALVQTVVSKLTSASLKDNCVPIKSQLFSILNSFKN